MLCARWDSNRVPGPGITGNSRKHAEYEPVRHRYGRVRRQGCAHCAHTLFHPHASAGEPKQSITQVPAFSPARIPRSPAGATVRSHLISGHLLRAFMVPTTNHCMTGSQPGHSPIAERVTQRPCSWWPLPWPGPETTAVVHDRVASTRKRWSGRWTRMVCVLPAKG